MIIRFPIFGPFAHEGMAPAAKLEASCTVRRDHHGRNLRRSEVVAGPHLEVGVHLGTKRLGDLARGGRHRIAPAHGFPGAPRGRWMMR